MKLSKSELQFLIALVSCELNDELDLYINSHDWTFLLEDVKTLQNILTKLKEQNNEIG